MMTKITTVVWDVTAKENLGAMLVVTIQNKIRECVEAGTTDGQLYLDYADPAIIQRCWLNETAAREFANWILTWSMENNNPVKDVKIEDISQLMLTK